MKQPMHYWRNSWVRSVLAIAVVIFLAWLTFWLMTRPAEGAGGDGCDTCSVVVTIVPTQDGEILGSGDAWVWEPYAAPLEYFVIMQTGVDCCPIPAGGRLVFIWPDGVVSVRPVTLDITPDDPVILGPYGFVPTSDLCPGVQANAVYVPAGGTVHDAASAINRLAIDPCDCVGDVDGSGVVDVDDLVGVILNWGVICPTWP